jgi:catechol 2,3-dioxygenase-like lactoylglutathione lyase family enzyme
MTIHLNHTIVAAHDKQASAEWLAGILGIETEPAWGPFIPVALADGVTLEYMDATGFDGQHYAFQVDEDEFDAIFGRVRAAEVTYYADPFLRQPDQINHHYGGRGVYFHDPNGHLMEIITQPYGPTPEG